MKINRPEVRNSNDFMHTEDVNNPIKVKVLEQRFEEPYGT